VSPFSSLNICDPLGLTFLKIPIASAQKFSPFSNPEKCSPQLNPTRFQEAWLTLSQETTLQDNIWYFHGKHSIEGKCEQVQILIQFPLRLAMKDFQSRL
jgi:hypothetical protein